MAIDRFDTIELPIKVKINNAFRKCFSAFLYELIILSSYSIILYLGFQFGRLSKSPLLNVVGLIISFLLNLISLAISGLIGVVTGDFGMLMELYRMLIGFFHTPVLSQSQLIIAIGLTSVVGICIRLIVGKLKLWQEFSRLNLIFKLISMLLLFLAGSLAIRHNVISSSYAEVLLSSTGLIAFSYLGFWRWRFWKK